MSDVEGRIALVTGASRGIGRATAGLLASRGAKVMGVARGEKDLAELGLDYCVADLGTPEGCEHAVAETFGVTSNAVLPGWVRTSMSERSAAAAAAERGITVEQVWEERAAQYGQGRVATPEEVAAMIAFLASEESSGVNGEAIRVALGRVD